MTTYQENAKERQEERWTVRKFDASRPDIVTYRVAKPNGDFVAYIDAPDTQEGRSTVAKMVAALQMETALEVVTELATNAYSEGARKKAESLLREAGVDPAALAGPAQWIGAVAQVALAASRQVKEG